VHAGVPYGLPAWHVSVEPKCSKSYVNKNPSVLHPFNGRLHCLKDSISIFFEKKTFLHGQHCYGGSQNINQYCRLNNIKLLSAFCVNRGLKGKSTPRLEKWIFCPLQSTCCVSTRVARFFLVKHAKKGRNIPKWLPKYQMTVKYTRGQSYDLQLISQRCKNLQLHE
jgi:hypothetical protein